MTDRLLFLSRGHPTEYGYTWPERGEDGPRDTPESVAAAAKLYKHIFGDNGPWVMVEVHPVPDADVKINEQAADDCRGLLEGKDERRGEATNREAQAPLPASVSATPEGSQRGLSNDSPGAR